MGRATETLRAHMIERDMNRMKCPVCREEANEIPTQIDGRGYDCPNCGCYLLSGTADSELSSACDKTRTILSHTIWTGQREGVPYFEVFSTHVDAAKESTIPSPAEQLDSLVLYAGDILRDTPGERLNKNPGHLRAKLCAILPTDVNFVSKAAMEEGFVQENSPPIIRLTMKGWNRYESLKKGQSNSKTAFMAMPFGVDSVNTAYEECFVPAVKAAGFSLERVDSQPEAGSIDDRIRVQIRNAKFVVADLTNKNAGAYWEAGYAEGLGKKVIYTCEEKHFLEHQTHFDTRQFFTVIWNSDALDNASERLTAVIRNSFPTEARMEDDVVSVS